MQIDNSDIGSIDREAIRNYCLFLFYRELYRELYREIL